MTISHAEDVAPTGTSGSATIDADYRVVPTPDALKKMQQAVTALFALNDGMTFTEYPGPDVGEQTPWGAVVEVQRIGPGLHYVNFSEEDGIEGYRVSPQRDNLVPAELRGVDGWYIDNDDVIPAMFPSEAISAPNAGLVEVRNRGIRGLADWSSRQMEALTGIDIGGALLRERGQRFDDALLSPVAAERYVVVGAGGSGTKVPGADWEYREANSPSGIFRRFVVTERERQRMPWKYDGPNGSIVGAQRLVDLHRPSDAWEVPEQVSSLNRLYHERNDVEAPGVQDPYVSSFASIDRDTVMIGSGVVVSPRVSIRGNVEVMRDVLVGRGAYIDSAAGRLTIPPGFSIGDHARIRNMRHLVDFSKPGTSDGVFMHPIERADHSIGAAVTFRAKLGWFHTVTVEDQSFCDNVLWLSELRTFEQTFDWLVSNEYLAKLQSFQSQWANDPSLRTLPDDFACVVNVPWDIDDGRR